jgi:hypothetical protein
MSRHRNLENVHKTKLKLNPVGWVRERLYRLSNRRLSPKLMPTFEDRECHVVSVMDL